jgi:hypothetical protein
MWRSGLGAFQNLADVRTRHVMPMKNTQSAYKTGADWCAICRAMKPTSPASIAARVALIDDLEECRGDAPLSEWNRVEGGFLFVIFLYQPHVQCHPEHISPSCDFGPSRSRAAVERRNLNSRESTRLSPQASIPQTSCLRGGAGTIRNGLCALLPLGHARPRVSALRSLSPIAQKTNAPQNSISSWRGLVRFF